MWLRDQKWTLKRTLDEGSEITVLREKVLGILGFGGIGSVVGRIAKPFGMQNYAYSRKKSAARGVKFFTGPGGLSELLKKSDGVVLALPLTSQTAKIMNAERLSEMRKDGILVNVARGEHYPIFEGATPSQHSEPGGVQDKLPVLAAD